MKHLLPCLALLMLWFAPHEARAFGTVRFMGQNAEHERITRAALPDLAPRTLDELAGRNGRFGAVGAPDHPLRGLMSDAAAHCDGGDHLTSPPAPASPPYPQSAAQAEMKLNACRAWIMRWLDEAVRAAAPLAAPTPENTALDCKFNGAPGPAKCKVLENFGIALHAAQDFYSHSNWTDRPGRDPLSAENPPGLGRTGPAPWLDPRQDAPFPAGLISGCYEGFPENFYCTYDGHRRVRHGALNKDTGKIENGRGQAGATPRGRVNDNFARAVAAAIADTADKWRYLEERLIAEHGEETGGRIICALTHDDPGGCS